MMPTKLTRNNLGYLQVAIGATMVSFSAVFVELTKAAPTMDAFYRMFFGGIILLVIALAKQEPIWVSKKSFFWSAFAGLLFACDLSFWHQSIEFIGVGLATIIINLQVFILSLCGLFFYGEKFSWKFLLALCLALIGMYLLIGFGWKSNSQAFHSGIVMAFAATCFYTTYIFAIRKSQTLDKKYPPIMNLAISSLAACLAAAVIAFFQGEPFFITQSIDWLWLLLYGLCGQVLGWLFISMGLPTIRLSIAGFLLLLQPALAIVWGIALFKQIPSHTEIVGSIITLSAIYIMSTAKQ